MFLLSLTQLQQPLPSRHLSREIWLGEWARARAAAWVHNPLSSARLPPAL